MGFSREKRLSSPINTKKGQPNSKYPFVSVGSPNYTLFLSFHQLESRYIFAGLPCRSRRWRGGGVLCKQSRCPSTVSPRHTPGMKPAEEGFIGAADGAGGVGGVPPLSSPRHTPGMKPDKEGFIGGIYDNVIIIRCVWR